jgi:hypothetical protein
MADTRVNEFYAELTAHEDAQWLDPDTAPPPASPLEDFIVSDVVPAVGTERRVKVGNNGRPLTIGQERWIVWVPGLGAVNGWDEHPQTIPASAFVQCRIGAVDRVDTRRPYESWLRVQILDVASFASLERRFPSRQMSRLKTWQLSGTLTRYAEWELWYAPQDDAGYWYAARLNNDDAHVVAAGEWVYGGNPRAEAWAGHIVIPAAAWRQICRGW